MKQEIPIIDIIISLSGAIDLINPSISNHHKRVAYLAYNIGKEMNFPERELMDIVLAGLLHDCGAVNFFERSYAFEFEFGNSMIQRHSHGYKGWFILNDVPELGNAAEIIKFHHIFWNEKNASHMDNYSIPRGSHILHIADRVDILINREEEILKQRTYIYNTIKGKSGEMFMPQAVEALQGIMGKLYIWFDLINSNLEILLKQIMANYKVNLDPYTLTNYANIAHRIIDFRSQFTATHSMGVAATTKAIAALMNFSEEETQLMYSAGLMHDVGKLCIPDSILEKPSALSVDEFNLMKSHTYHTYRIIDSIPGLGKVRDWAAFHHEKLDGTGYPFGKTASELDLGSRILTVCDIFTALTEDRPYRKAVGINEAISTINKISNLDDDVKLCLNKNLYEINEVRKSSQESVINQCFCIFKQGKLL